MLDILNVIEARSAYYLPEDGIDTVFNASINEDLVYLVTPEKYFYHASIEKPKMLHGFYICGIFDLGEVYSPFVDLRFSLYLLSKKEPQVIKTSVYKESLFINEKPGKVGVKDGVVYLSMPDTYPDSFLYYITEIEKWNNEDVKPKDSLYAAFNEIRSDEFSFEAPYALRYTSENILIHEQLKHENVIPLSELADIYEPSFDNTVENVCSLWIVDPFEYPLKTEYFNKGTALNFRLKKGDILANPSIGGGCMFNFIPDEVGLDLYSPANTMIIRSKKGVSPEYLFMYLNSNTGRSIIGEYTYGLIIESPTKTLLSNIPVVYPRFSTENYRKLFEVIYVKQKSINEYSEYFEVKENKTVISIINNELRERALKCRNKLVQTIIDEDLTELELCLSSGAYKATLIMAGSILEAFLTDWLSELDHKDYFTSRSGDLNLCNIINRIKAIKAPDWMDAATASHNIRNNRNLVHAKLCLKKSKVIDKKLCDEVVEYLTDVINTRNPV